MTTQLAQQDASSTIITFMGMYNSGKRTMLSNYFGQERDKIVERKRSISQTKASKDGITLQELPVEHGRMSAYRQRIAAVKESKAFVFSLRNSEPKYYDYFYELIEDNATSIGPLLVIATYITDETPEINPLITAWATSINAEVRLLNVAKLKSHDLEESKHLTSIIAELVQRVKEHVPVETQMKPVVENENTIPLSSEADFSGFTFVPQSVPSLPAVSTSSPTPNDTTTPLPANTTTKKEEKEGEIARIPPMKKSKLSRVLAVLARGGSVA